MKISAAILSLLLPVTAIAQNFPGMGGAGMSEQDIQNMMQQAQKMQTCMGGIDQSQMGAFEQRAKAAEARVKSLCASGKRDEAQDEAMAFALEMKADPNIQKIMECSKGMDSMMSGMPYMGQDNASDKSGSHVCDE